MKTILTKFLAMSSVALLMLSACKKNDAIVTSNGGKPGTLTPSTTTPVLDKTKLNDPTKVITFTFTAPNYGFTAAPSNTLQIDAAGDNWKNPQTATLGVNVLSQGYSTAEFNALLLKLNLPAGVASQVQARIVHTVSPQVTPIYSNVVNLTVTPFNLASWVYAPGSYQGWNNDSRADSLLSATSNGIFSGIINFTAGNRDFLLVPVKGSWAHKYATNDAVNTTSSTVTYDGPNNFYAPPTPGNYLVTLNVNTNTISFEAVNFYSVIGDAALGWGTDSPMKFINSVDQTWSATLPLSSTGSFKIRENNDWTNSWGIPKAGTPGDGVPNTLNSTSNNNITVATSGTHTVTFTIPIAQYKVGGQAPATALYSVQ
jgi:hypothetical protein